MSASLEYVGQNPRSAALSIFCKANCKFKGQTSWLNFNPSWTSDKDTPYKDNKISCPLLSNFTLTISNLKVNIQSET